MKEHNTCPKEGCNWDKAKEDKDIRRHVWTIHGPWAEETGYPSIKGRCDECGKIFKREDFARRHEREVHGKQKRDRKGKKGG